MGRLLQRLPRGLRWLPDVAIVLAVLLGVQAWQTRDALRGPAPEIAATTVGGEAVSLADYGGRPLMLHFWATWCGVCQAAEPNLVAVAGDHPVLTVASRSGGAGDLARYLQDRGLSLPVIADPEGELARRFGVRAFPTSFVLDGDGGVRHVEVGYTTELGMRARLWLAGL